MKRGTWLFVVIALFLHIPLYSSEPPIFQTIRAADIAATQMILKKSPEAVNSKNSAGQNPVDFLNSIFGHSSVENGERARLIEINNLLSKNGGVSTEKAASQSAKGKELNSCVKCGKKRAVDENFCGKCGFSFIAAKNTPGISETKSESDHATVVFEYKTLFIGDSELRLEDLDSQLNKFGAEGWEVISQRRAKGGILNEWGVEVSLKRKIVK